MSSCTFSELKWHYMTGRSYVVSGTGRNRVMGYRRGVMCDLGDLELSDWKKRVLDLIEQSGEMELYQKLIAYVKAHYPWCKKAQEIELKALQLHAYRIFENPSWDGYAQFHPENTPQEKTNEQEGKAHECKSKANRPNAEAD